MPGVNSSARGEAAAAPLLAAFVLADADAGEEEEAPCFCLAVRAGLCPTLIFSGELEDPVVAVLACPADATVGFVNLSMTDDDEVAFGLFTESAPEGGVERRTFIGVEREVSLAPSRFAAVVVFRPDPPASPSILPDGREDVSFPFAADESVFLVKGDSPAGSGGTGDLGVCLAAEADD